MKLCTKFVKFDGIFLTKILPFCNHILKLWSRPFKYTRQHKFTHNDLLDRRCSDRARDEVTYFSVGDVFCIHLGTTYSNFQENLCFKVPFTLVKPKVSDISRHKADLYFLMRNDPYFHVGYVPKINSGSTHNIKFQKKTVSLK